MSPFGAVGCPGGAGVCGFVGFVSGTGCSGFLVLFALRTLLFCLNFVALRIYSFFVISSHTDLCLFLKIALILVFQLL